MSTKKEILEYFKDINYAYNDSSRYDTLERMLSELEGETMGNEERCVICGEIIPEGRQVCPICENGRSKTMPRYIDAEELKRLMNIKPDEWRTPDERWLPERDISGYIDFCPAADVVEVVRCKDCIHCVHCDNFELWCVGRGFPSQLVNPQGFCDKGEKGETDGNS